MLLGPRLMILVCRAGDASMHVFTRSITVLVASLFLAVHLPAFAPVFLLWLFMVGWSFNRRRSRHQQFSAYNKGRLAPAYNAQGEKA